MSSKPRAQTLDVERAVLDRYTKGARRREDSLCCPVDYDPRYLDAIPADVLERDYGCGDPSRYAREGDTVLDLGSGSGKICFIASQIVGPEGRVIGVDMNEEMLALARTAAPEVARRVGFANVSFRRGGIQDLGTDLDLLDAWLGDHPVRSAADLPVLENAVRSLRVERPLVPDASIDLVVSNCVLNLVRESDKPRLLTEIFRVLKPGGRIAISDIVSDETVPGDLRNDPELWSGCVSGAFQEDELMRGLEDAGFYGIAVDRWAKEPFRVIRGIEFRAVTMTARKGKEGPCFEANEAVVYKGPWKTVEDDDHHVLRRGVRTAVCAKTYRILTREPYAEHVIAIPPRVPVPESNRRPFDCARTVARHPRETKGQDYVANETPGDDGCPPGCC